MTAVDDGAAPPNSPVGGSHDDEGDDDDDRIGDDRAAELLGWKDTTWFSAVGEDHCMTAASSLDPF